MLYNCVLSTHSGPAALQYAFGAGETTIMRELINSSESLVLAGRTMTRVIQPKGHKMLHKYDFLWTSREVSQHAMLVKKAKQLLTI